MTAIAGIARGGKVWIGGDAAGVDWRYGLDVQAQPKVFQCGDFVIGYTTSFRMGQLLQHSLSAAEQTSRQTVEAYMATTFVDAVRSCLKTGGFAEKEKESEVGGTFLVGYRGRLFRVQGDYAVLERADGIDACGCGDFQLLGALHALTATQPKRDPAAIIRFALEITEANSAGVRGPFTILEGAQT